MIRIQLIQPHNITHIISITVVRRIPVSVVTVGGAVLLDLCSRFREIGICGVARGDCFAVGLIVPRAIEKYADTQSNSPWRLIVQLDFFLLFFEFVVCACVHRWRNG